MIKIALKYEKRAERTYKSFGGLSENEVEASRKRYGANVMSRAKRKSFWRRFAENLGDPVIKILIGALIINVIFTFRHVDWLETVGIAVSILLATTISTLSEHSSAAAFERLDEANSKSFCRVVREGRTQSVAVEDIVVGDILLVGAGERIAADGHLLSGEIAVDQSAMTGESREVYKRERQEGELEDKTPASPSYCLRGCTVLSGEGTVEVSEVGDRTYLGGISREIQTETRDSPLRIRLTRLARQISIFGYIAAALIALIYLFNTFVVDSAFDPEIIKYKLLSFEFLFSSLFHALTLGLTVLIVAVPEGLPVMTAVVLSSNVKRMVKDQVLVRKSVGIEAAGSMNILFTDKTGTLTEGKMSLGEIYLGNGENFTSLSGLRRNKAIYDKFILNCYANTTSSEGYDDKERLVALGGNSTDRALLEAVMGEKISRPEFSSVKLTPFDSDKKYSSVSLNSEGKRICLVKGAPELLLPCVSSFFDENGKRARLDRDSFFKTCRRLSSEGKRILLIAESDGDFDLKSSAQGLTLICLVTLEDKIRREAAASVASLRGAGIQVVMITGDSKETAESIARECGILSGGVDIALTSSSLAEMTDTQLKEILPRLGVVARALPNDKSRLVRISQETELVVGMTGDGINDAPALKRADVGFAMGSGTQVAKDAGDIIILDNNLSSIAKAVLYGRNIFKSIRKFISLQLMMNLCAVGVSMICPFLGVDSPVTVVQMLWINIIMDTLGGLAFAGEPALPSCMKEKPKRRDEPILNGYMINEIIFQGGFTVALCIAFLKIPGMTARFRYAPDNIYLLTAFFALFIFASVFNCFNARTDRIRLLAGIGKNKLFIIIMAAVLAIQIIFVYLGGAWLRTAPLTLSELLITAAAALLVFPAELLRKLLWRLFFGRRGY